MKDLSNENIVYININGVQYIQFRKLLEYKELVHCFTLKPLNFAGYDSYKEKKKEVDDSYNKICKTLDISAKDICRPKQTHTDRVEKIFDGDEGIYNPKFDNVDALVTNSKNKALTLCFADCTPLLFYDPVKNVIANTHSGWKGTYQEIASKTVKKLIEEYDCKPEELICCIGPHIRKCHFEVDQDVRDMFYNKFKNLDGIDKYISKKDTKYYIDTLGINTENLIKLGLKNENIIDSKICTVCESNICHSFRAEKENSGRSIALIELI